MINTYFSCNLNYQQRQIKTLKREETDFFIQNLLKHVRGNPYPASFMRLHNDWKWLVWYSSHFCTDRCKIAVTNIDYVCCEVLKF